MIVVLTILGLFILLAIADYAQSACSTIRTHFTNARGQESTLGNNGLWCPMPQQGTVSVLKTN